MERHNKGHLQFDKTKVTKVHGNANPPHCTPCQDVSKPLGIFLNALMIDNIQVPLAVQCISKQGQN